MAPPPSAFPDGDDAELDQLVARSRTVGGPLDQVPALSAFLRRVEAYPQLSAEDQLRLVAQVRAGTAAESALAAGRGTGRDRAAARRGRTAADALVGSSFRLVLLICRERAEQRFGRERALDMLPDLVAEANVALAEAIATFDPELSPTFSTYAARKVRDRVAAALNEAGPIRLASSWNRLKRIASVRIPQLTSTLGRTPTKAEIQQDLLGACLAWADRKLTDEQRLLAPEDQQRLRLDRLRKQGMLAAIESIDDVLTLAQGTASLDAPASSDGTASLGDLVAARGEDDNFEVVEHEELRATLMAALDGLTERERRIVLCRYGFVDGTAWTYPRIAAEFGVTAERIRQIERAVLERLRAGDGGHLSSHLD